MKKQQDIYRSVNKVRATKGWTIIIGIFLLIVGAFIAFKGESVGFTFVGIALILFLIGGLIEGFAEIVKAACKYNNPDDLLDDSEVYS